MHTYTGCGSQCLGSAFATSPTNVHTCHFWETRACKRRPQRGGEPERQRVSDCHCQVCCFRDPLQLQSPPPPPPSLRRPRSTDRRGSPLSPGDHCHHREACSQSSRFAIDLTRIDLVIDLASSAPTWMHFLLPWLQRLERRRIN